MPEETLAEFEQLPANERQALERQALDVAKSSSREFFVKNLQGQLDKALKAGVPETADYVRDYRATIRKIEEMR